MGWPSKVLAVRPLTRQREIRFVEEFAARMLYAAPDLLALTSDDRRRAARLIGLRSLRPAGYRFRPVTARGRKMELAQSDTMLALPRVQAALAEKFEQHGLGSSEAARLIAELARGKVRVLRQQLNHEGDVIELESDVAPGDRLRALDMMVRMTFGYAPTKSTSINANVPVDALFDPQEFASTPTIDVTPPPERPGKKKRP